MSFGQFESARAKGSPINLFYFKTGPGATDYFAYTDHEENVTRSGVVYTPIPIARGDIVASGDTDKSTLEITLPHDLPLSQLFIGYPPDYVVSVTVYQGHFEDGDFPAGWSGVVRGSQFADIEVTLSCSQTVTALKSPGLRRPYQVGCPFALYGEDCRASQAAATIVRTVVSTYDGSAIALTSGWNVAALNKYLGGVVQWPIGNPTQRRSILQTGVAWIRMSGPYRQLNAGDAVEIILGCDHTVNDCLNLHRNADNTASNVHNFGGQEGIPLKNPIQNASTF